VLLAGVATFGIASAAAAPPPPTRAALVATRDLIPGARLRPGDAALASRAIDVLPSDAMAVDAVTTGRVLVVPVRAGEVLRARDLVTSHLVAGLGPGLVATPVRLADGSATSLLAPGDVVDVLAATAPDVGAVGSAQVVAAGVRVLVAGVSTSTSEAVLGATGSSDGGLLVVATTPEQALDLARAGAGSHLSVTLRPN
jgi:Flp pilus assembly protein CpaB